MNLKLKYSILFSFIFAAFLGGFSTFIYLRFRARVLNSAQQDLVSHLDHESQHLSDQNFRPNSPLAAHTIKDIHLQIWRNDRLITDLFPPGVRVTPPVQPIENRGRTLVAQIERRSGDAAYRILAYYDLSPTLKTVSELGRLLGVGCMLSIALTLPLSWWFIACLLGPFKKLSEKTSELTAEKLCYRFTEPKQSDEYGTLVKNFNSLLDNLQNSFAQAKRFASNASHEFRTPLAIIQGEAQVLLRRARTVQEYESGLANIVNQTKILQRIISQLLFFADLERIESVQRKYPVKTQQVIQETLSVLQLSYASRDITVRFQESESSPVFEGYEELFASIVNNLCENAFKHCRSTVEASCRRVDGRVVLIVDDDGPGIPQAQRKQVFEPFAKLLDMSGRAIPGHGLGLSIVRSCILFLQGEIELSEAPLGGLRVWVSLPA